MKIVRRGQNQQPFEIPTGARDESIAVSYGHVVIPSGRSSRPHYNSVAVETYFILSGRARMVVNEQSYDLQPCDFALIMPLERVQIFALGESDLEFLEACYPGSEPNNTVFLNK